jgi:hypothetical protein
MELCFKFNTISVSFDILTKTVYMNNYICHAILITFCRNIFIVRNFKYNKFYILKNIINIFLFLRNNAFFSF